MTPTWRESRKQAVNREAHRSTCAEGSRTGTSQLAVATRERLPAARVAEVRTIDSGKVAVTSGGYVRLRAAEEAPPDGCDSHSHANGRPAIRGTWVIRPQLPKSESASNRRCGHRWESRHNPDVEGPKDRRTSSRPCRRTLDPRSDDAEESMAKIGKTEHTDPIALRQG